MIRRENTPVTERGTKVGSSSGVDGHGAAGWLLVRLVLLLAVSAIILDPMQSLAQEEPARIALVIGNAAYSGNDALKNPVNDAQDVAAELRKLGFSVIERTNLDEDTMRTVLGEFYRRLAAAQNALALLYFAGHGSMESQFNYLWPVGVERRPPVDFVPHAFAIEHILQDMKDEGQHRGPKVVIIDACRDNSRNLTRGGDKRGLDMKPSAGTLIALAASPGKPSKDNPAERNGLYTKHLLERLRAARGSLRDVFDDAGNAVFLATGGDQIPQIVSVAGADTNAFRQSFWPGSLPDEQTAENRRLHLEIESKKSQISALQGQISALEERINAAERPNPGQAAELARMQQELSDLQQRTVGEIAKYSMPTFHPPPLPVGLTLCTSNISLAAVDAELLNTGTALVASFVDNSGKSRGIHLPNVFSYTYREFSYVHYAVEPLPGTYVGSTASGDSVMLTVQAGPKLTEFQTSLNVQTHRGTFNVVPLYREMDACPFEKGLVVAFLPNKAGHAFLIIRANAQQQIAGYLLARANRQEEIVLLQFRANRIGR